MITLKSGTPASGMTLQPMPPCASCPLWHDSDQECGWPDCTPPVENSEAPGASGAEDGQGACIRWARADYVLIFPGAHGPELREFDSAASLCAFLSGFQPSEVTFLDRGHLAKAAL